MKFANIIFGGGVTIAMIGAASKVALAASHQVEAQTASQASSAADFAISIGNRGAGPLEIAALLTLLSLAPALLIMLTSFTRIVIVLSLLRQALGLQQTPPNIVITGLAMFLSMIVMAPTWMKIRDVALDPYMAGKLGPADAAEKAEAPLRDFMLRQTRTEDIEMARGLLAKGQPQGVRCKPAVVAVLRAGAGICVE